MQGPAALLMIDMSQAYFDASSPLCLANDALRLRAVALLDEARRSGMPVLHTRVEFDKSGINGGLFFKKIAALKVFCKGSPLGEFADGLAPREDELVFTKQYASAFFGTTLSSTLQALNVKTLIIGGVSTSGCVRATAVDAIQYGYTPVIVRDAVGDRHESLQSSSLLDLQAKYAEVIGLDRALELCHQTKS
jgi:maleamate amidohydrolase